MPPGDLHEISHAIGRIEGTLDEVKRLVQENKTDSHLRYETVTDKIISLTKRVEPLEAIVVRGRAQYGLLTLIVSCIAVVIATTKSVYDLWRTL